jgi:nucleotide-binding universal stress UspA family protein
MDDLSRQDAPAAHIAERLPQEEDTPVFKKILVPVDLADVHQQALDIAARLATESDGEVILLHVVEVITGLWAEEEREFYDRLERKARDHLARLGRDLEERAVR